MNHQLRKSTITLLQPVTITGVPEILEETGELHFRFLHSHVAAAFFTDLLSPNKPHLLCIRSCIWNRKNVQFYLGRKQSYITSASMISKEMFKKHNHKKQIRTWKNNLPLNMCFNHVDKKRHVFACKTEK